MELNHHQFVSFFPEEQAKKLCHLAIVETFAEGKVIFEEGEKPDFLYLVLDGKIEFRKYQDRSQYQIVTYAFPNEFFGEFGVLDGEPRSAQAVVATSARLAKISSCDLIQILDKTESSVILKLFQYIIQRFRITTAEYVKQLAYKDKIILVGEMVNTIMHDFKSPLSGIRLASEMIQQCSDQEEIKDWCNLINIQTQRMTTMAADILDFTKGNNILNKQSFNLKKSFDKFLNLNHIYFSDAQIAVTVDCPAHFNLYGDEQKLLRVWQNLSTNAVEAFQDQQGAIKITVKPMFSSQIGEGVQIQFKDDGKGIDENLLPNLFDPFLTLGKKKGTGLGTAIIKSIIEAHSGTITVSSQKDQGTTFTIYLPLQSA